MLMAQISDTHIATGGQRAYGIVDTAGLLRACVADVVRLDPRPDLVVLTGDLVDHGRPEEYALLQELLALAGDDHGAAGRAAGFGEVARLDAGHAGDAAGAAGIKTGFHGCRWCCPGAGWLLKTRALPSWAISSTS
ncbi:hypothetical protein ET532_028015 [Verminephrobacter sp. Larva24]|nr:hypothetical protein ET532_028015 [Verminephrobacter sp. Larva24]